MIDNSVLFISTYLPGDFARDIHGSYQRMRMFVDAMGQKGWNIHFLFFVSPQRSRETDIASAKANIKKFWKVDCSVDISAIRALPEGSTRSFWKYYIAPALSIRHDAEYGPICGPEQLAALTKCLAARPACVFAMGLEAMLPLTLVTKPPCPVYFDMNDIEHKKALRTLAALPSSKGKWLRYFRVRAMVRAERAAVSLATRTFVWSDADKAYLEMKFVTSRIRTIPNAVEVSTVGMSGRGEQTVLFVGLSVPSAAQQRCR